MYGFGSNESSFLELLHSSGYNLLTRLETLVDNPHRPDRLARLHGAYANFVIGADNRHLIASLRLRNGALRQQESAFFHVGFDTHTSILAGTQNVAGIRKGSNDANCARAWIHLPVRQQDFPSAMVETAVRQDQIERASEKANSVPAGTDTTLPLCAHIILFANREKSFDGFDLRNGSHDRIGSNEVADLDLCNPRNSIDQRGDFGPLQVECGLLQCCPARFDGGLSPTLGLNIVI